MTVDVVALVVNYLKSETVHAVNQLADSEVRPVVRVEEAGGGPTLSASPNRLTKQDIQIDVWDLTRDDCWTQMANVRDLLLLAPRFNSVHDEGVFISVRAPAPIWVPDESWPVGNRPGPRFLMIVGITAHI